MNWNLLCCNLELTNVKHGRNEGIVYIFIRIRIHSTIKRFRHNLSVTLASVILNFGILNLVGFIFKRWNLHIFIRIGMDSVTNYSSVTLISIFYNSQKIASIVDHQE